LPASAELLEALDALLPAPVGMKDAMEEGA
jgi:hypothetical protein